MTILDFLEIGTADFDTEIEKADNNTRGFSIEPLKIYLDNLPEKPLCKKFNCAISNEDGDATVYYISPDNIKKYNFPHYTHGCNSIDNIHPVAHWLAHENNLDVNKIVDKVVVKKYTLMNFLHAQAPSVSQINYLKVDTEGHDTHIIQKFLEDCKSMNLTSLLPHKIRFESNVLNTPANIQYLLKNLEENNYTLLSKTLTDIVVVLI